ncbi:MAG: ABC transporter ATP-binding protein [Clostridia bacterium]|nr:ABC transporter ATP-binding protein [Clostridia bacterium]
MINIRNVTKKYGDKTVYDNFSLDIEEGVITAVLGESGAGKTTLLNMIAGLTDYSGEISGNIRPASMVFQQNRLVPHLTVAENLKLVKSDADIESALNSVGLADYGCAYPKSLSAGMARRVALIRAFLYPSPIILMDEPLINLDLALKYRLTGLIKKLQKESGRTVITVTHDIGEAVMTADRIVVLKGGKVVFKEDAVTEETAKRLTEVLLQNGDDR